MKAKRMHTSAVARRDKAPAPRSIPLSFEAMKHEAMLHWHLHGSGEEYFKSADAVTDEATKGDECALLKPPWWHH